MIATSADALFDKPISIRLTDVPASHKVVMRATATDDLAHRWASHAEFVTDSSGAIDLARIAPIAGSYSVADANGLLWSMTLDPAIVERTPFVKTTADMSR